MIKNDVQLIYDILSGDDTAFTALVQKYQKSVHALAWRKVGDFHYAEEITQDTFLQVYKKLATLKDPRQFSGWLYVMTNRICSNWMRKNNPALQALETTPMEDLEKSAYARYVSEQREIESTEHRHEIAKRLLEKLPESERTVMTLYYLGEMTTREISRFLGVSVHTITSRLQRAKKRLQQDEERLVQEILGRVQLPDSLIENIVQGVADMKPTPTATGKPLLPWAAFGAAAVLVTLLLLGLNNQYLVRFQKPYSFEAQSEPTIEIIDTPIVLDVDAKPAVQNRIGRATTADKSTGDPSSKPQESQLMQEMSGVVRSGTHKRFQNRSFPSVFQAWDNLVGSIEDKQTSGNIEPSDNETLYTERLTKHDLHWSPFFGLWWETTAAEPNYGLSTQLSGELEAAKVVRQQRLALNPNMLFLVEIRIHNHLRASAFPPDSQFWLRDSNNRIIQNRSNEYMMDFLNPDLQNLLIQRIVTIAKCGLFDGIIIAGFHANATGFMDRHFHDATDEEIIAATIRILREVRTRVQDDFLIIVNTHRTKPTAYVEYVNGTFIETRRGANGSYTREGLQRIENTLLWAETQLREPQLNCLEGEGIGTLPPDSPENLRWVRVFTTLSLTHSDGYVLYTDGMRAVDPQAQHHAHYWYPFWNANLGQPVGKKAQRYDDSEGLFIREFINGWVVYNRSGKAQKIQLPEDVSAVASGVTDKRWHTVPDLDGEIFLKKIVLSVGATVNTDTGTVVRDPEGKQNEK